MLGCVCVCVWGGGGGGAGEGGVCSFANYSAAYKDTL